MKTHITIGLSLLSTLSPLLAHGPNGDHETKNGKHQKTTALSAKPEILGHGNYTYRVHKDWGKLNPQQHPIKNCHAMVQLKNKDFLVLCDDTKHNFLLYNPEGKLKKAWMTEYPGAHGLELFEQNGKEFLIIVDSGWAVRNGKQYRETGRVAKTSVTGQLVFGLGHPQTVGAYNPGQTYMPCDAAVAPNGDIYIADGYGSQWVTQYDKHGRYIRKFGGPQDPNPSARLKNSHGVSIDLRDPKNPKLIVSSRGENKLKFFTMDGKFLHAVDLPGAFGGQAVVHGENLYVGVCWSKEKGQGARLNNSGFIAILDKNNQVISCPGGNQPTYVDGKIQPMYQTTKTFMHVHDLCISDDGDIYVVQWNAKGAYPIKLERVQKK